jgi:Spy/CpxP family protein refolding chaperone
MKTKMTIAMVATLGALALAVNAQDNNQPPGGPPPSDSQPPAQHFGGPGGRGGFHLLPPRAAEQLKLTDDQKTQLAALEAETKAKLEKILTPEQMTQLKNMRPPMRQGGPGGGQMRGGPDGQGQGNGPGADDNNMPAGPPPGDGDNNTPPAGPPPGGN